MLWVPISLMAYAFGSMVWSHTFLAGVEGIRWFLLSLLLWVGLTTLNLQTAPKVIWGVHGGLVVASLWTVLQFWWDFKLFPQGPQPASSFVNRNFFAEYAVTVLPFSVWVLVTARRARWLPWVAASVAINVLALLMTGTRSALIALFLLIPVLLLVLTRYRTHWAFETWNRSQSDCCRIHHGHGYWRRRQYSLRQCTSST
jgi:O-antigen ligase